MSTCIKGGAVGWQKGRVAPGAERERSCVRLKAAERQPVASPCDLRGTCSSGAGIRSSLRALPQGAHLIGGCAPGCSPSEAVPRTPWPGYDIQPVSGPLTPCTACSVP